MLEEGLAESLREAAVREADEDAGTVELGPPLEESAIVAGGYPDEVADLLRLSRSAEIGTLYLDFTGKSSELQLSEGLASGPLVEVGYIESMHRLVAEVGPGAWGPFWRIEQQMMHEIYLCATLAEFIEGALEWARPGPHGGVLEEPSDPAVSVRAADARRKSDPALQEAASELPDDQPLLDLRGSGLLNVDLPKGSRRVSAERIYRVGSGRGVGCVMGPGLWFLGIATFLAPYGLISMVTERALWVLGGGTAVWIAVWILLKRTLLK